MHCGLLTIHPPHSYWTDMTVVWDRNPGGGGYTRFMCSGLPADFNPADWPPGPPSTPPGQGG